MIRAIEAREDDQFVNRWYGFYLESLINVGELQRALTVADSCIKDLQDIEGFVPHNCLHQKALISTWTGGMPCLAHSGLYSSCFTITFLVLPHMEQTPHLAMEAVTPCSSVRNICN